MRRSKILCTVGPASSDPRVLEQMVEAGMDAARLNFSHGTPEGHRRMVATLRSVAARTGRPLPILQDLQGPKIRVGELGPEGRQLTKGAEVLLAPAGPGSPPTGAAIPIGYERLAQDLAPGDAILMDDGLLQLEVLARDPSGQLRCGVVVGGHLKSRKGVNLPGAKLSVPSLTPKDRRDVVTGVELGVDLVALSFVRSASDVVELRGLLAQHGADTPIIAKIEKPEAIEHQDAILAASEGLMVARGDLGVELRPERVPLLQRHMVEDANAAGKLVIIATQMLDSMARNPRPTRAEVTDVATAVMQGADATMLSNETAVGAYPVEAVAMMAAIVKEVEGGMRSFEVPDEPALIPGLARSASAIGRAAVQASRDLAVAALAVFTGSGRTAALVSDYRPQQPILALTTSPEAYRRMGLLWGVVPVLLERGFDTTEQAAEVARAQARRRGLATDGDQVVLTLGQPSGPTQQTNLLWVVSV